MSNKRNCLSCKYKRCINGALYCVYSPKICINGDIVNAKTELCNEVLENKKGKCFKYANWSESADQGILRNSIKKYKKIVRKIKNEVNVLK